MICAKCGEVMLYLDLALVVGDRITHYVRCESTKAWWEALKAEHGRSR